MCDHKLFEEGKIDEHRRLNNMLVLRIWLWVTFLIIYEEFLSLEESDDFMKNTPKFQIYIGFFMVIIAFLQSFNHWGEKEVLSYFFLIGGIGILVLNFVAIYKLSKKKKAG